MPIYGFSIGRDTAHKVLDELALCTLQYTNWLIMREFQFNYSKHMTRMSNIGNVSSQITICTKPKKCP